MNLLDDFDVFQSTSRSGMRRLLVIAGPCQIESLDHCLSIATKLKEYCSQLPVQLIFKSSFDKANRTSIDGTRGPGMTEGLQILRQVREQTALPVLTDIHLPEQAAIAAQVVDILQIPAFLCRQTDLLLAAASTGLPIHLKKGQFLHPADMLHAAKKIQSAGGRNILLCERGSTFGYRDLIVDMRNLMVMRELGFPVVFDATHSVQIMGGASGASSGAREYVRPLARAAVAVGVDGLFFECHENPQTAPSDGASMLELSEVPRLLEEVCAIREVVSV